MATKMDTKLIPRFARPLEQWEIDGAKQRIAGQPDELMLLQMLGLAPCVVPVKTCAVHGVELRPRVDRGLFCYLCKSAAARARNVKRGVAA